ncbi:MAG TPA: hypothetical protein VM095_20295 [Pyrinomonadaceae bacterium]|nr:hypothetical protein [Pyrinomonadaceae bacterium]
MRKLILIMALPALLLTFAAPARAQDERPEFKMPCRAALKLGLNKFINAYGEKTEDYSTYGQKQAFEYWVNCKRPANDALAARLLSTPHNLGAYEAKRLQVDDVRDAFNKFGTALWGLRYLEEGGGTMWGLISVGAYAERENFMEIFIKTLALSERRSPLARRNVNASLSKIQRWLASNKRKPFTEGSEPEDIAQRKQSYQETIKETQDALSKLRDLLRDLPDLAASRLAAKMAAESKNALADTP